MSRTDRTKDLRQKAKATASQKGVDAKERGIVQRIEQNLTKLADLTNIKSGNTFTLLKRLNAMMEKEIQKLEASKMKNDMGLIMEGWRHTTLLEGVVKAIQDKSLEPEDVKKIGDKLSAKDPGFTLAVQFFNALSQTDPEEMDELGEGAMDWINSKNSSRHDRKR